MADVTEPSADEEMIAVEDQTEAEEKPTTDIDTLKKAVADEPAETEAEEPAKETEAAVDESSKNNDQQQEEEEEEYVLKDEAHEEEDGQKETDSNGKAVNGSAEEKDGKTDSLGSTIAKHYNSIPETGRDARKQSRIFYLRNFNNWVKSVLINEFLEKARKARRRYDEEITVLDLGCGKGGDLLKWQKGRVGHLICADIAETSVEQCKERYDNLRKGQRGGYRDSRERLFTIECIAADCTKTKLEEKYKNGDFMLDLTSCQFAFHYAFESYKQAEMMIENACAKLRPGGYFIGSTPDSNRLVKHLKKSEGNSFGNEVYNIEFENKDQFDVFGTKYHFKLHEVVDCPEFLVYFPIVEKLAAKHNMKLVYKKSFHEFFSEKSKEYGNLMHRMQALEGCPPRKGWSLVCDREESYEHVKAYQDENKIDKEETVGTLTKDEWEAAGLYLVFAFEKIDPEEEEKKEQKEKSMKRAASPGESEEASAPPSKKTRSSDSENVTEAEDKDKETKTEAEDKDEETKAEEDAAEKKEDDTAQEEGEEAADKEEETADKDEAAVDKEDEAIEVEQGQESEKDDAEVQNQVQEVEEADEEMEEEKASEDDKDDVQDIADKSSADDDE